MPEQVGSSAAHRPRWRQAVALVFMVYAVVLLFVFVNWHVAALGFLLYLAGQEVGRGE